MKLAPGLISILKILDKYFQKKGISYALIGAQVPRILIDLPILSEHRPTKDIDIAIKSYSWNDFEQIKKELINLGFKEDHYELRFFYQDTIIDIIPYLENEITNGLLKLPGSENTLNVYGFDRLLKNSIRKEIQPGLKISIVPLHLLIFTKILAFLDRGINHNVLKDIEDMIFIFQNYETLEISERRFDATISLDINYEDRGAFLIGYDLKHYLKDKEQEFVVSFLEHFHDEYSPFIQRLTHYDSDKSKEILSLFESFRKGFEL
ncbi:MAG: hypothetical protein H8D22_00930 [Candidatus Cloacimonetes bacterium]|nr:hypothetical protein [Candidatus Cloacimonadota bacterium]